MLIDETPAGVIACIYYLCAPSHTLVHTFVNFLLPSCLRHDSIRLLSPNTHFTLPDEASGRASMFLPFCSSAHLQVQRGYKCKEDN
jgi:hypothetical protein